MRPIQNSPLERVRFVFEIRFGLLSRREEILEDNGRQPFRRALVTNKSNIYIKYGRLSTPEESTTGLGLVPSTPDAWVRTSVVEEHCSTSDRIGLSMANIVVTSSGGAEAGSAMSPCWGRRDSHSGLWGRRPHECASAPSSGTSVQTPGERVFPFKWGAFVQPHQTN